MDLQRLDHLRIVRDLLDDDALVRHLDLRLDRVAPLEDDVERRALDEDLRIVPAPTRSIIPTTWLTKTAMTSGSDDRVTVRIPSGSISTSRVIVPNPRNMTASSALSSGVAFTPRRPGIVIMSCPEPSAPCMCIPPAPGPRICA